MLKKNTQYIHFDMMLQQRGVLCDVPMEILENLSAGRQVSYFFLLWGKIPTFSYFFTLSTWVVVGC